MMAFQSTSISNLWAGQVYQWLHNSKGIMVYLTFPGSVSFPPASVAQVAALILSESHDDHQMGSLWISLSLGRGDLQIPLAPSALKDRIFNLANPLSALKDRICNLQIPYLQNISRVQSASLWARTEKWLTQPKNSPSVTCLIYVKITQLVQDIMQAHDNHSYSTVN